MCQPQSCRVKRGVCDAICTIASCNTCINKWFYFVKTGCGCTVIVFALFWMSPTLNPSWFKEQIGFGTGFSPIFSRCKYNYRPADGASLPLFNLLGCIGSVAMCAPHTHRHLLQLCVERRCALLSCHYSMSGWSSSRPTPRASPAAVFQPQHLEHTGRNRMEKAHGSPHQYGSLGRTEWTTDAEKHGECRARSSVCWVIMKIVEMLHWDCCKCRVANLS